MGSTQSTWGSESERETSTSQKFREENRKDFLQIYFSFLTSTTTTATTTTTKWERKQLPKTPSSSSTKPTKAMMLTPSTFPTFSAHWAAIAPTPLASRLEQRRK